MYTPLFIRTEYSLLSSLIKIDALILKLKKLNITECAICDNNLFGTMEFIKKCKANNIKPVVGLCVSYKNSNILLYAKNINGYHNLIKIETIKNEQEITLEILKTLSSDIICICYEKDIYETLNTIFTDIYVGVKSYKDEGLVTFTKNVIYVNETLYLESYEYKYLPYVFMIRDGKTIKDGLKFIYQDNYLKSYDELNVSKLAIENTKKVSNCCNLVFDNKLYMPKYSETCDSKKYLEELTLKGLTKRLNGEVLENYKQRLEYELKVIIDMHFEDYFLVVYDFIRYAKQNGILVGPGRGSAAGSLVCYSLGITEIDPIKYNLLFERFLNKDRVTLPDIDTDFPDDKRDDVISYVKRKYGERRVSGIITFGTLKAKQCLRDVGRVLNVSLSDIDYITKRINVNESLRNFKKRDKVISSFIDNNDILRNMYEISLLLEDNKRHTSIHAAGIVISRVDIDSVVPIIKEDDMYLTEYTMEYLEEVGLIKMDFLGIRNLSIIKNIILDVKEVTGDLIDFNKINLLDSDTYKIFQKGDTTGIFQFESAGMKRFLIDLHPENFSDISNAIALYRPGPAVNIPSFVARKKGYEKIDYITPLFTDILKDTYGIIVYQEQIMQIARVFANFSLSKADLLRRAMSKKKIEILKTLEEEFINGGIANGYPYETGKKIYDLILNFANYGFNKSHSVAYSLIAYKMAYLKAHYPKEFYSNLLGSVLGSSDKTKEYIDELKVLGINVLPPDINKSYEFKYKIVNNGLIMPLASIKNIGGVISSYINKERLNGNFKDIYDFFARIYKKTNNIKVIQSLIYAHAFDSFGYSITTLINNYETLSNYATLENDLGNIDKPGLMIYGDDLDDILVHEKEVFGFYLTSHKTEKYKLMYKNLTDVKDVKNSLNKKISVVICAERVKELQSKKGKLMCFIQGSDNTGKITFTIFPDKYEEIKKLDIKKQDVIVGFGKAEKRFNDYNIIIERIKKLN